MADECTVTQQDSLWDRIPRLLFVSNAFAFAIFAVWHRETPSVALIALGFAGLFLICWGVLFKVEVLERA